jgi:hypothetical protein
MSKFNELFNAISEDVANIKFRSPRQEGSESKTAGLPPGEEGYDTDNVDFNKSSTDLETEIKNLIMNSHIHSPSITEDDEVIDDAIREFLGKIGYSPEEEADEEYDDTEDTEERF